LANRHWSLLRVGVLEQACLIEPEAAPPPAHPFPIRNERALWRGLERAGLAARGSQRTGLVAQLASQPNAQA
jgi:hypothetical protein